MSFSSSVSSPESSPQLQKQIPFTQELLKPVEEIMGTTFDHTELSEVLIRIEKVITLKDFIKKMEPSNDSANEPRMSYAVKQGSIQRWIPNMTRPNWHVAPPTGQI